MEEEPFILLFFRFFSWGAILVGREGVIGIKFYLVNGLHEDGFQRRYCMSPFAEALKKDFCHH